jgi:hypothetical protein
MERGEYYPYPRSQIGSMLLAPTGIARKTTDWSATIQTDHLPKFDGLKENFTRCPLAFHDFHGATGAGRGVAVLHVPDQPLTEGDGFGIIT